MFNDPMADRVEWTPTEKSPGVRRLVQKSRNIIEFEPNEINLFTCKLFLTIGIGLLLVALYIWVTTRSDFTYWLVFCGVSITLFGAFYLYIGTVPVLFDREKNIFTKGKDEEIEFLDEIFPKVELNCHDIYVIQLVRVPMRKGGDHYQLNLVDRNGQRVSVGNYYYQKEIQNDAAVLGAFLAVPVWDTWKKMP